MANEKRLIDANALLGEIERIYTEHYEKSAYKFIHDFFRAMIRRVRIAPTVDAVEVKHGRWLTLKEFAEKIGADPMGYEGGWVFCSECDQKMRVINGWNYCPNCGADMRERNTNDN